MTNGTFFNKFASSTFTSFFTFLNPTIHPIIQLVPSFHHSQKQNTTDTQIVPLGGMEMEKGERSRRLVVGHDPRPSNGLILGQLFGRKPKSNLLGCRLESVRGVDQVPTDGDGVLAADRAGIGVERVGGAYDSATLTDDILALPNHRHDRRTRGDILDERGVERTSGQVGVMFFGEGVRGGEGFDSDELVATLLKAGDDLANELPGDTIRLDHDKRPLGDGPLLTGNSPRAFKHDRGPGSLVKGITSDGSTEGKRANDVGPGRTSGDG